MPDYKIIKTKTGHVIKLTYYENGKIESKLKTLDKDNNGIFEEYSEKTYDDKGRIERKEYYKNNNQDDYNEVYISKDFIDGKLVQSQSYTDRNSDGKKETHLKKFYHMKGYLQFLENKIDKNSDGIFEYYNQNNYFDNGKLHEQKAYIDKNSNNNKEWSNHIIYSEDGKIRYNEKLIDKNDDTNLEFYISQTYNEANELVKLAKTTAPLDNSLYVNTYKQELNNDVYSKKINIIDRDANGITEVYNYQYKDKFNNTITSNNGKEYLVNSPLAGTKAKIKISQNSPWAFAKENKSNVFQQSKTGEIIINDKKVFSSSIEEKGGLEVTTVDRFNQITTYETSKSGVTTKNQQGNIIGSTEIKGSIIEYNIPIPKDKNQFTWTVKPSSYKGTLDLDNLIPKDDPKRDDLINLIKSQPANIIGMIAIMKLKQIKSEKVDVKINHNGGYQDGTIALNQNTITDEVFTHELAHAIDDYIEGKKLDASLANPNNFASNNNNASRENHIIRNKVENLYKQSNEAEKTMNTYFYNARHEAFAISFNLHNGRYLNNNDYMISRYALLDKTKSLYKYINNEINKTFFPELAKAKKSFN